MRHDRHPTNVTRLLLASLVVASTLATAGVAVSATFAPESIVFPVVGDVYFTDTFDAPRSGGRTHGATDIMSTGAVKGLPVVAAADGVVDWIGSTCCYLSIDHGGGWETWYIHLDNDTPGTDDGLGWGIADGIAPGVPVTAGQLIGWLGDSGNAEWTAPHLHFEIRKDGVPINPYPYLLDAPRLSEPGSLWQGQFRDDDGSVHEADIEELFARGITYGCNATQDRYCPDDDITRGEMAAFIRRALGLEATGVDAFVDDDGNQFEEAIDAIAAVGIALDCDGDPTRYCPDRPLDRAEMAEMLVRAFAVPPAPEPGRFHDDDGGPYEASIEAIAAVGITVGCDPSDPGRYCPDDLLTRAQMASFFIRSLDWAAGR